jgi:hypothetical protein
VTLVAVAEESLWFCGSTNASALEVDACEKELTLGVGGVSIGASSLILLLLEIASSIVEEVYVYGEMAEWKDALSTAAYCNAIESLSERVCSGLLKNG